MQLNKQQKICRICFAVLVAVTILCYCVALVAGVMEEQEYGAERDDIFGGTSFSVFFIFLVYSFVLAVVVVEEFLFYLSIKYFLGEKATKTTGNTVLYALLLAANCGAVIYEICDFISVLSRY